MKINNIIMIIAFAIMMCCPAVTAASSNVDMGSLRLSFVNQEPDPAEPGEYADLRFKVENIGDEAIDHAMVELMTEYPFSLNPGTSALEEIGTLTAFQKDDSAYVLKYKVKIDEGAVEGANKIKVRAKFGREDWETYEFDINIRTIDANLAIESVTTTPSPLEPGKVADVSIKVKNMADSVLKDISVNLDLTLGTIGTASLDSLPFAPIGTGTEKQISKLSPSAMTEFKYTIKAYPEAEAGVYKIPLEIKFYDELGTEYTKNDIIGIVVNSEPDLSVILDQTTISKAGQKGEVSIRFINKGLTDIKFVDAIIGEQDSFDLLSTNEVYLGNIDSDDYENADYEIFVKPTDAGKLFLPLHYEYMDANNNKYSKDIEIEVKLFSEEEQKQYMTPEKSNMTIFLVIGGVIVLFVLYRIFRKKK